MTVRSTTDASARSPNRGAPYIATVFLLVAAGFGAPSRAASPPDSSPQDLYGWYTLSTGENVLLEPSATDGLFVADFDQRKSSHMARSADGWHWQRDGQKNEGKASTTDAKVIFEWAADRVQQPSASGFRWGSSSRNGHNDDLGTTDGTAKRSTLPAYNVAEASFRHGELELSATLYLPTNSNALPGAVFIHGSGASDRDNLWYQMLVHRLASNGVAVLLPDKRGSGKSQGDWTVASFDQFAGDAAAGLEYLRSLPTVDSARLGLVGISQGGWIAPLCASQSPGLSFVVNISGAAVTPNEQVLHELGGGVLGKVRAKMAKKKRPLWWQLNGDFDPIPYWSSLQGRGLIVYGAEDEHDNVPVKRSVELLRERVPPQVDLTVRVFDGSDHGIRDSKTGHIREDFLKLLVTFVRSDQDSS